MIITDLWEEDCVLHPGLCSGAVGQDQLSQQNRGWEGMLLHLHHLTLFPVASLVPALMPQWAGQKGNSKKNQTPTTTPLYPSRYIPMTRVDQDCRAQKGSTTSLLPAASPKGWGASKAKLITHGYYSMQFHSHFYYLLLSGACQPQCKTNQFTSPAKNYTEWLFFCQVSIASAQQNEQWGKCHVEGRKVEGVRWEREERSPLFKRLTQLLGLT